MLGLIKYQTEIVTSHGQEQATPLGGIWGNSLRGTGSRDHCRGISEEFSQDLFGVELENSRSISERVSELLAEREKVHGQATAAAIERVASVISGTEKVGKINTLAAQALRQWLFNG
jgi:hypothetical protein